MKLRRLLPHPFGAPPFLGFGLSTLRAPHPSRVPHPSAFPGPHLPGAPPLHELCLPTPEDGRVGEERGLRPFWANPFWPKISVLVVSHSVGPRRVGARELQTCTFEGPPKIPREDPQRERQKERKWWREREKKARNFGPPTLRGPPSRAHTLRGPHPSPSLHPLGPPLFLGLDLHPSGPEPSGPHPSVHHNFLGLGPHPSSAPHHDTQPRFP